VCVSQGVLASCWCWQAPTLPSKDARRQQALRGAVIQPSEH
jgi:hypothetical protein